MSEQKLTPEDTKEQARPDFAAARVREQAEKKEQAARKSESRELDKELDSSMDASDPPSSIQP